MQDSKPKRLVVWVVGALLMSSPLMAQQLTLTPDVPSLLGGTRFLANQTVLYSGGAYTLSFDGSTAGMGPNISIDAITELPNGDLLFSTDTPFLDPGGTWFQPADVVLYSGGLYSLYFAGGSIPGLTALANIDALALDSSGNLVVSFDAPVTVAAVTFDPHDLVQIVGTALTMYFDGSMNGLPVQANISGAASKSNFLRI